MYNNEYMQIIAGQGESEYSIVKLLYMYKDVYMGSTCGWTRGCILHVHTCTCIRMFTWAVHVDGQEAVYYIIHVHV